MNSGQRLVRRKFEFPRLLNSFEGKIDTKEVANRGMYPDNQYPFGEI